jgi:hypothetical protein
VSATVAPPAGDATCSSQKKKLKTTKGRLRATSGQSSACCTRRLAMYSDDDDILRFSRLDVGRGTVQRLASEGPSACKVLPDWKCSDVDEIIFRFSRLGVEQEQKTLGDLSLCQVEPLFRL